jgi:flagellar basal-body rod modification protein FlgD
MVGYVGKTIEAKGGSVFLSQGRAEFAYALDGAAAKTTITITDSAGKVVRSAVGQTSKGQHSFVWDGRNDQGVPVPDGTYKTTVTATDGAGKPVGTTTTIVGRVTGLTTANGTTALTVNGLKIPLSDVVSVRDGSST